MNGLVLVVAGVFVVAGLALIVLSFLVGRTKPDAPDLPSSDGEPATFIDEPLEADITAQLGKARTTGGPPDAAATPDSTVPPHETTDAQVSHEGPGPETPVGPTPAAPWEPAGPERAADAETGDAETATGGPTPGGAGGGQVSRDAAPETHGVGYNFRVQLGFKFLKNGLHEDAVREFQKALALTDDPSAKLKLYVEIGNTFRAEKMYAPASAAYLQATTYATDPALKEHLERTLAEMAESETAGSASPDPGADKEEEAR